MSAHDASERADQRRLREQMRGRGMSHAEIATEMARWFRLRPRKAWRIALGWTLPEAAERYNALRSKGTREAVTALTGSRLSEWESWPFGTRKPSLLSLCLLAEIYQCGVLDLIDFHDREKLPPDELIALEKAQVSRATAPPPAVQAADTGLHRDLVTSPAPPGMTYRGLQESVSGGSCVGREVEMAAHDGSEHAERAEQRDIGDATLEQLRSDVIRLSHEYMTGEPFPLFLEMRRVRNRMHDALDRRLWPRDATELYLMTGCLNGLMASAANNLGYPDAAGELIRAGWAYATVIDHRPLMAWLRMDGAYAAYWGGRPRQSLALAESGLEYLPDGQNAAQLHLHRGLAAAHIGDVDTARQAINAASEARERDHHDELLDIGGDFGFSRAAQHYYAGFTLSGIPQGAADAITELEQATDLYAAGPGPGEDHSQRCRMLAHADLATARLRASQLDAAIAAVEPVLALSPGNRTALLTQRLTAARTELADARYRGSPQARALDERIEEFRRDTIAGVLSALPG